MIRTTEQALALIAQLEKEFEVLGENFDLNRQAWERINAGAEHPLDWAALGYTLHIIYTSMESYFLRISKAFENNLPGDSWHKELLDKMQLELPGVRPALFDRSTARIINEFRGFRHVFRSLYDDRIDPERIRLLQKKVPAMKENFSKAHTAFCEKLSAIFDDA